MGLQFVLLRCGRLESLVDFGRFSEILEFPRRGFPVLLVVGFAVMGAKLGLPDGVPDGLRLGELFQSDIHSPFLLSP